MVRGSTPTHIFHYPVSYDMVKTLLLTYKQNGEIILRKGKEDMTEKDGMWSITLTQEETNLFSKGTAYTMIRGLLTTGKVATLEESSFKVYDVHDDEVLT